MLPSSWFFPLELNHENMPTNRAYQDDHAEVCLVVMTNFLNCEEKKIKLRRKVGIYLEFSYIDRVMLGDGFAALFWPIGQCVTSFENHVIASHTWKNVGFLN